VKEKCKRCGAQKDWQGSDIRCPFQRGRYFTPNNWNCGIIKRIRNICYGGEFGQESPVNSVFYQYCDDMHYAVIKIDHIEDVPGLALWVAWYKHRGGTDAMWILDGQGRPHPPTFDELVAIVTCYER